MEEKLKEILVTEFGREMYEDKYLLSGESILELYHRITYANIKDNPQRAERVKEYFRKLWFCGATPVMSNSGTDRGYPISCYVGQTKDDMESITMGYIEDIILGAGGGGIGRKKTVRSVGEPIAEVGSSSGKMPFYKIDDAIVNGISQGALRRASKAEYLDVSDPEIEEFIKIRKPTGGDTNRKCFNLHHGVNLTDKFMKAVINKEPWDLISVRTGEVVKTVDAYKLFTELVLITRMETGEPYLMFIDNANNKRCELYEKADYKIELSQLCNEIYLNTSTEKTAVCCLSSVNLEKYDEWKDDELFIEDIMYFLDGVINQYLDKLENSEEWKKPFLKKVVNFIKEERAVGLGVMGYHGLLQQRLIPMESPMAKALNIKIFKDLKEKVDKANIKIGTELGACELAKRFNMPQRFSLTMAIAPTSSISILTGEATAGIEPRMTNCYVHKNGTKAHTVKNPFFNDILNEKKKELQKDGRWVAAQWKSVITHDGSVQHLDFLTDYEKEVFKTAYEIDQRVIIQQAADRQEFIDQGQSLNLFVRHNIQKRDLLGLHLMAWKLGLKGLYYCRSTSPKRATVGHNVERQKIEEVKYDECIGCQ